MIARLTDRPRTLAEARPDHRWSSALQAVIDRALAARATERFTHASDLASALARALSEDGGSAAAGLDSRARVGPERLPPTVARGAPRRATVPLAAAPGRKRSAIPLVGALALILAGAALGAVVLRSGGSRSAEAPSLASTAAPPAARSAATVEPAAVEVRRDVRGQHTQRSPVRAEPRMGTPDAAARNTPSSPDSAPPATGIIAIDTAGNNTSSPHT